MNGKNFTIGDYLPALEETLGTILHTDEMISGVYYIETELGKRFSHEYYAVLDTAPIAAKVQNYGEKMDGLRLFSWDEPANGNRIVYYEVCKYKIAAGEWDLTEYQFRDASLHSMELHPEYFGAFPVPIHTPWGHTLLHRTLSNGIYWLETSQCRKVLAVCPPVWEAELSYVAKAFGENVEWDGYLFFPKEAYCIPIYELMETRKNWDGTVIDRPALMNAIWEFLPTYALHLNGRKERSQELDNAFARLFGIEAMPEPHQKNVLSMHPDAGTAFLLLE